MALIPPPTQQVDGVPSRSGKLGHTSIRSWVRSSRGADMRTNHGHGIAFGLTAGALAVALACSGCSGTAQNGSAGGSGSQNSSTASNVETSNVATDNQNANAGQDANASNATSANGGSADSNANANGGSNANANATTVIIDGDAEDAKGTLPDGWYLTSLTGTEGTSNISAVSVSGDTWTLTGSLTRADSEDALYGDASRGEIGPSTWNLKVASGATFEAGSNSQPADRSTFESTLTSLNGLGLVLHVEGGQVTYARLAS